LLKNRLLKMINTFMYVKFGNVKYAPNVYFTKFFRHDFVSSNVMLGGVVIYGTLKKTFGHFQ
jgi:hypothetical protein